MAEVKSFKVVVVGDGTVGKTSLLMAYVDKKYTNKYVPTIFDNRVTCISLGQTQVTRRRLHLGLI